MPDSSDIDNALINKLRADAQLAAVMPDGIHWDVASTTTAKRFVTVSFVEQHDVQQFGERAFEDASYEVIARGLSKVVPDMDAAEDRIDALLDHGTLTVTGYGLMTMYREERIRINEPDDVDPSILWFHRGGRYRLVMST